jgi:arylsulfatase A
MSGPAVLLPALLIACSAPSGSPPAAERPNVVLIISDDQAYGDFGFMGNRLVQTPNLDRLAAQSARYLNGYVPSSVCSPSLATILTGLYPHQNGIHYNHPPPGNAAFNAMNSIEQYVGVRSRSFYLIRSAATLPRLLGGRGGYLSLQTGKFWEGHFSNAGFSHGMTVFEPVPGQDFGGNRTLASGLLAAHGNGDRGLQIGRRTMRPIRQFIDRSAGNPFLVWYAPYLPHQPHDSPPEYQELYRDNPAVPRNCVRYYASISQFDDTVGELIDYVEEAGLAKNTIFVFLVDNGWQPGTREMKKHPQEFYHTKRSKRAPFDYGLRTPILIRWDDRVIPATHQELVSSIDILPTILAATGCADKSDRLPGIDLLPSALGGAKLDPRRPVFGEIYPGNATSLGNPSRDVAYRWVRQGNLKLIAAHSHNGQKPWAGYLDSDALFDVVDDPDESVNLIDEPGYVEKTEKLQRLLDQWWTPGDDSKVPKPPE